MPDDDTVRRVGAESRYLTLADLGARDGWRQKDGRATAARTISHLKMRHSRDMPMPAPARVVGRQPQWLVESAAELDAWRASLPGHGWNRRSEEHQTVPAGEVRPGDRWHFRGGGTGEVVGVEERPSVLITVRDAAGGVTSRVLPWSSRVRSSRVPPHHVDEIDGGR